MKNKTDIRDGVHETVQSRLQQKTGRMRMRPVKIK
jgi:hypothetical protein